MPLDSEHYASVAAQITLKAQFHSVCFEFYSWVATRIAAVIKLTGGLHIAVINKMQSHLEEQKECIADAQYALRQAKQLRLVEERDEKKPLTKNGL